MPRRRRPVEEPYPYALPFRPKAQTVVSWVLVTRTPAGAVEVPINQSTCDELVEAGCSWTYRYARSHGRPHTVVLITDNLPKARQDRLQRVLRLRGIA